MQKNARLTKLLVSLLVLGIVTAVLGGCGRNGGHLDEKNGTSAQRNGDSQPAGKKEITLWMKKMHVEDSNRMIVQRVKEFAAQKDIKTNVEIIAYEDFLPKCISAIESGKTPDVSFFGYQEVGQFYEMGLLRDLSSLYNKLGSEQGAFYPGLKNAVTFEGRQYGIPFWAEATVMYYRKDLLAAAGFREPPRTWEDYREVVKATTDPAKGIYGAGIGYGKGNSDSEWFTRAVLWSYGGAEVDKDGRTVTINSPASVAAAKFISDLFLVDKSTPPSAIGWDDSGNNKAYLSGQAVTVFNTGSIAYTAKIDNPDLYKNTGVVPLPAGPEGRFIPGIENTLGIFNNSRNPELAQQLIEFMLDKAWYSSWIDRSAPLLCPVYSELGDSPIWNEPMNKPFIQSVKDFTFLGYKSGFSSRAGQVYNIRLVNDTFEEMILNKLPPEKAMQNLQAKMQEIYNK